MKVLAIDTALQRCSAAVTDASTVIAEVQEERNKGHAERLAPLVAACLKDAGLQVCDIDRIAVHDRTRRVYRDPCRPCVCARARYRHRHRNRGR